mgnify:FL=1
MKLLSVLLFLIVAVSILLVSILINPDQIQNQYFWITVGWLIVLSALNWIASTSIFIGASQSNANSRTYGILPPLNILVFIYSLFSGILLLSTWYVNDFGILPNWHLILQIILFAIVSTLSVLMFIAAKAAKVDDVKVALNKEDLIKVLQSIRSLKDLNEEKKELIEELIEIVRYSIPHLSKLNSKDNYNQLSSLYRDMNMDNYLNIKTSDIEKSIYLAKNC